jgi:SWI/SNF-related matrix-associated actin-dependent regulator 1 of chromatin subfamily A
MIRRLKKDVLQELPPKVCQIIPIAANGAKSIIAQQWAAWQWYQDATKQVHALGNGQEFRAQVEALREGARVAWSDITRFRKQIGLAKVPAVIEAIESALQGGKIVCFAHHHEAQDALMAHFKDVAVLHRGGLSDQEKQQAVDRFQNDPSVTLFIGSIRASGTGLTLTASSHIIFAEQDWTPAVMSQCEDRCHRIGQQESLFIQHLVFDGSLDATMLQRQSEKQDVIDLALDGQTGR